MLQENVLSFPVNAPVLRPLPVEIRFLFMASPLFRHVSRESGKRHSASRAASPPPQGRLQLFTGDEKKV